MSKLRCKIFGHLNFTVVNNEVGAFSPWCRRCGEVCSVPKGWPSFEDYEGVWEHYKDSGGVSQTIWHRPKVPEWARCDSMECLFGREWIHCKKRRGHKGEHRNCETWGWDEGDEPVLRNPSYEDS